jgi:glycerol uptake facilitator-like aquaporin
LVEFFGTALLTFTIFWTGNWLAIGAALAIAVFLGGAYNPAVVFVMYHAGKISKSDVIPYILVEILGGITGFYMYKKLVNKSL